MKNYVRIAVYEFVSIVYLFIYTALMRYIGDDGNPFIEHFFLIYFIIPNILWIVFGALISKSFGIVAETNKENLTLSIENFLKLIVYGELDCLWNYYFTDNVNFWCDKTS